MYRLFIEKSYKWLSLQVTKYFCAQLIKQVEATDVLSERLEVRIVAVKSIQSSLGLILQTGWTDSCRGVNLKGDLRNPNTLNKA